MSMHMAGAVAWGAVGLGCLIRAVFRANRAVVKEGTVLRCAGDPNSFGVCDPGDVIETAPGEPVYSTGKAEVVAVGPYFVHLAVENDPVVLAYEGLEPEVEVGQYVGVGQRIGTSDGRVSFIVTQFKPGGAAEYVPPSAWLAVRGMRLVVKNEETEQYCTGGREIVVPQANKKACGLRSPDKAKFALLPVTVEFQ